MEISFNQKELQKIQSILKPQQYNNVIEKALTRLGGDSETRIGLEAHKTVYSYKPKTNRYVRKGRLLGGRGGLSNAKPYKERLDKNTIEIKADATLRGAKFNYSPFVNAGKGWMKRVGARPFWDNSIKWIKAIGVKKVLDNLKKDIDKILKG
jgi:hypothetical protein